MKLYKVNFIKVVKLQNHLALTGIDILISKLRATFWIFKNRAAIRDSLSKCMRFRRQEAKRLQTIPSTLPEDSLRHANDFEDLADPLTLANEKKIWIILFTCVVFRRVLFELILSLAIQSFLLGFRRFISQRGRPSVIYSNNGSNFDGANNLLKAIDWKVIEMEKLYKQNPM